MIEQGTGGAIIMNSSMASVVDPQKQQQVKTFTPMARRGKPEELVGPVIFLASQASSYVTGTIVMVDGGYSAI